eukprot:sb/3477809/
MKSCGAAIRSLKPLVTPKVHRPFYRKPTFGYRSARCGLSSTYHHVPLAWGCSVPSSPTTWPTRRYHSIMLIHDWLDTGAFSPSLQRYMRIFRAPGSLRTHWEDNS